MNESDDVEEGEIQSDEEEGLLPDSSHQDDDDITVALKELRKQGERRLGHSANGSRGLKRHESRPPSSKNYHIPSPVVVRASQQSRRKVVVDLSHESDRDSVTTVDSIATVDSDVEYLGPGRRVSDASRVLSNPQSPDPSGIPITFEESDRRTHAPSAPTSYVSTSAIPPPPFPWVTSLPETSVGHSSVHASTRGPLLPTPIMPQPPSFMLPPPPFIIPPANFPTANHFSKDVDYRNHPATHFNPNVFPPPSPLIGMTKPASKPEDVIRSAPWMKKQPEKSSVQKSIKVKGLPIRTLSRPASPFQDESDGPDQTPPPTAPHERYVKTSKKPEMPNLKPAAPPFPPKKIPKVQNASSDKDHRLFKPVVTAGEESSTPASTTLAAPAVEEVVHVEEEDDVVSLQEAALRSISDKRSRIEEQTVSVAIEATGSNRQAGGGDLPGFYDRNSSPPLILPLTDAQHSGLAHVSDQAGKPEQRRRPAEGDQSDEEFELLTLRKEAMQSLMEKVVETSSQDEPLSPPREPSPEIPVVEVEVGTPSCLTYSHSASFQQSQCDSTTPLSPHAIEEGSQVHQSGDAAISVVDTPRIPTVGSHDRCAVSAEGNGAATSSSVSAVEEAPTSAVATAGFTQDVDEHTTIPSVDSSETIKMANTANCVKPTDESTNQRDCTESTANQSQIPRDSSGSKDVTSGSDTPETARASEHPEQSETASATKAKDIAYADMDGSHGSPVKSKANVQSVSGSSASMLETKQSLLNALTRKLKEQTQLRAALSNSTRCSSPPSKPSSAPSSPPDTRRRRSARLQYSSLHKSTSRSSIGSESMRAAAAAATSRFKKLNTNVQTKPALRSSKFSKVNVKKDCQIPQHPPLVIKMGGEESSDEDVGLGQYIKSHSVDSCTVGEKRAIPGKHMTSMLTWVPPTHASATTIPHSGTSSDAAHSSVVSSRGEVSASAAPHKNPLSHRKCVISASSSFSSFVQTPSVSAAASSSCEVTHATVSPVRLSDGADEWAKPPASNIFAMFGGGLSDTDSDKIASPERPKVARPEAAESARVVPRVKVEPDSDCDTSRQDAIDSVMADHPYGAPVSSGMKCESGAPPGELNTGLKNEGSSCDDMELCSEEEENSPILTSEVIEESADDDSSYLDEYFHQVRLAVSRTASEQHHHEPTQSPVREEHSGASSNSENAEIRDESCEKVDSCVNAASLPVNELTQCAATIQEPDTSTARLQPLGKSADAQQTDTSPAAVDNSGTLAPKTPVLKRQIVSRENISSPNEEQKCAAAEVKTAGIKEAQLRKQLTYIMKSRQETTSALHSSRTQLNSNQEKLKRAKLTVSKIKTQLATALKLQETFASAVDDSSKKIAELQQKDKAIAALESQLKAKAGAALCQEIENSLKAADAAAAAAAAIANPAMSSAPVIVVEDSEPRPNQSPSPSLSGKPRARKSVTRAAAGGGQPTRKRSGAADGTRDSPPIAKKTAAGPATTAPCSKQTEEKAKLDEKLQEQQQLLAALQATNAKITQLRHSNNAEQPSKTRYKRRSWHSLVKVSRNIVNRGYTPANKQPLSSDLKLSRISLQDGNPRSERSAAAAAEQKPINSVPSPKPNLPRLSDAAKFQRPAASEKPEKADTSKQSLSNTQLMLKLSALIEDFKSVNGGKNFDTPDETVIPNDFIEEELPKEKTSADDSCIVTRKWKRRIIGHSQTTGRKPLPLHLEYTSPLCALRSYRLCPDFLAVMSGREESRTWSHRVNPHIALCQFQLHGMCNDKLCPYQHENDYLFTRTELALDLLAYLHTSPSAYEAEPPVVTDSANKQAMALFQKRLETQAQKVTHGRLLTLTKGQIVREITSYLNRSLHRDSKDDTEVTHLIMRPRTWRPWSARKRRNHLDDQTERALSVSDPKVAKMADNDDDEDSGLTSRYFIAARSQSALKALIREDAGNCRAWIEISKWARDSQPHKTESQCMTEGLSILARGLESNQTSEMLWNEYLALYARVNPPADIVNLCKQATQYVSSSILHNLLVEHEATFEGKVSALQMSIELSVKRRDPSRLMYSVLLATQYILWFKDDRTTAVTFLRGYLDCEFGASRPLVGVPPSRVDARAVQSVLTGSQLAFMWMVLIAVADSALIPEHAFFWQNGSFQLCKHQEPFEIIWREQSQSALSELIELFQLGMESVKRVCHERNEANQVMLRVSLCQLLHFHNEHRRAEQSMLQCIHSNPGSFQPVHAYVRMCMQFAPRPYPENLLPSISNVLRPYESSKHAKVVPVLVSAAEIALSKGWVEQADVLIWRVSHFFYNSDIDDCESGFRNLLNLNFQLSSSLPPIAVYPNSEQSAFIFIAICLELECRGQISSAVSIFEQALASPHVDCSIIWPSYLRFALRVRSRTPRQIDAAAEHGGVRILPLLLRAVRRRQTTGQSGDEQRQQAAEVIGGVCKRVLPRLKRECRLEAIEAVLELHPPPPPPLLTALVEMAMESSPSRTQCRVLLIHTHNALKAGHSSVPLFSKAIALCLKMEDFNQALKLINEAKQQFPMVRHFWLQEAVVTCWAEQSTSKLQSLIAAANNRNPGLNIHLK